MRAHDAARADGRADDAARHMVNAKLLEPDLVAVRLGDLDEIDDPTEQLRLLDELHPRLLAYGWLSPSAFADLDTHRPVTLALVRALRAGHLPGRQAAV